LKGGPIECSPLWKERNPLEGLVVENFRNIVTEDFKAFKKKREAK
jgi:hypothetical protein